MSAATRRPRELSGNATTEPTTRRSTRASLAQIGGHEILAALHHPPGHAYDGGSHLGLQPGAGQHRRLPRQVRGDHRPARRRHPGRGPFDDEIGDFAAVRAWYSPRGRCRGGRRGARRGCAARAETRAASSRGRAPAPPARFRWRAASSIRAFLPVRGRDIRRRACGRNCFSVLQIYHTTGGNCLPRRKFMAYDGCFQRCVHDHARPDASAHGVAQVEPRPRRAGVCHFLYPGFPAAEPAPAPPLGDTVATVEGREITAGEFRRTYDAQLQAYRNAYGAQRQRTAAQAARHRAADSPAARRSAGGARRGRAARHHARATKKCDSASSRRRRSRKTARSSASSAISSCCARSGRR